MNPLPRAVSGLVVQAALLGFAIYFAFTESALPSATTAARIGLVVLFVVASFVVGEVSRVRTHVGALLAALRAGVAGAGGVPRDDKAAVDVLVRALSAEDADVRVKAHRNLVRLTGKSFTMDPAAWQEWWKDAREGFVARDVGRPA